MKSKVLAIAAIMCMICCNTASAQWPHNTYGNTNQWEVELGTRILDRPSTDLQFSLVTSLPTTVTVFNAQDASDLDMSAGADIRFSKKSSYDHTWEVKTQFNAWNNFESRTGVLSAPAFTPAILPIGTRLTQFDYEYDSKLFNFEVNYKRSVRPGLTLMIGPRYVDLTESNTINSRFDNPLIPGFFLDLDSQTDTNNHMPGLGFGAEIRRPLSRQLFFVGAIKGAVLANFASTETISTSTVVLGPPTATTIFRDSETQLAGIGEFSVKLHYDVAPGTVSCYTGYEAMWLDGVALGPAQLMETLAPPIALNTSSTSFMHGFVGGMMIRY